MPDTFLEEDHPRIISAKFGWDWLSNFRGEDFINIPSPLFSIFRLAAILVGSRDHQTQIWKGGHPRTIPPKFGCNWPCGFWQEISIFSNGGHLGWRAWLSDTILKGGHPWTIPAEFGLNWHIGFWREDYKCEKLTTDDDGWTTDETWSQKLTWPKWPGELKWIKIGWKIKKLKIWYFVLLCKKW